MDAMEKLPRLDKRAISISSFNDIEEERQFRFSKGVSVASMVPTALLLLKNG